MHIEVYSVKSFTGNALKAKLEEALRAKNLPFKVRENHNVDDFIREGLTSVPAVKIGHQILSYHEDQPFQETIEQALDMITASLERCILVPVDFTDESIETLKYAAVLADKMDLALTVAHIHEPLFDPVTGSAFDQEMMTRNESRLHQLVDEITTYLHRSRKAIDVRSIFKTGDVRFHLQTLAEDEKTELVVMSTHAANTWSRRFFGTIPLEISRHIHCPLLIVPPGVAFRQPEYAVVAVAASGITSPQAEYLASMVTQFQLKLECICVTDDAGAFERMKNHLLQMPALQSIAASISCTQVSKSDEQAEQVIADFAESGRASWIILFEKVYAPMISVFHHHVIKHSILDPAVPVLLVPSEIV